MLKSPVRHSGAAEKDNESVLMYQDHGLYVQ